MKTQFLALLAAGLLLLCGCKKDADLIEADCEMNTSTTIGSVLAKYATSVQKFLVNPGTYSNVTTTAGSRIIIPPGLVKRNGQALSASQIEVQVREVTKRSEMIFSHTPTVSNWQLLESGGMFNITFSQDGVPLDLSSTARLQVTTRLPNGLSSVANMQLFTGQPDSTKLQLGSWTPVAQQDTATRVSLITTWSQQPGNPVPVPVGYQVSLSSFLYNNNARSLNWVNIDRFVGAAPLTQVQVQTGAPTATGNTEVHLVFNSLNSVLQAYGSQSGTFYGYQIPQGYSVTAVVLRRDADQLYFGKQTATVAANQVFAPTLRAVTEAELVAEIQQL